jgi:hypothetical protein
MEIIRADRMQLVRWYDTPEPNVVTVKGDMTQVPLYAGFEFEFRYRFGPATMQKPTPAGGLGVVRRGRLQILNWLVSFDNTGLFDMQVFREGRNVRLKRIVQRRVGKLMQNYPTSGTAKIMVLGKADDCRVDIANRSHMPCWFTSASWEGEFLADSMIL